MDIDLLVDLITKTIFTTSTLMLIVGALSLIFSTYISMSAWVQALSLLLLALSFAINYFVLIGYGKKYRLAEYHLSTAHAIFATIYGYIGFMTLDSAYEISNLFIICGHVTLGYFAVDLINIITKNNKNNVPFILHHIVFALIIVWMIYARVYHLFGNAVIFTEMSTIFLNSYYVTLHLSQKKPELKKFINVQMILFAFVFFVVRIVFLTWLVLNHSEIILNDFYLILSALFSLSLNYFWFYKLIKKIQNKIQSRTTKSEISINNENTNTNIKLD